MNLQSSTISTWGKSTAVRLPAQLVKQAGLQLGQSIQFEAQKDGTITMRPILPKLNLDALLSQVTPENLPDEGDLDWGKPVGSEIW
jgi:antitoxin MazE